MTRADVGWNIFVEILSHLVLYSKSLSFVVIVLDSTITRKCIFGFWIEYCQVEK